MRITLKDGDAALIVRENGDTEVIFPHDMELEEILLPTSPGYIIGGLGLLLDDRDEDLFTLIDRRVSAPNDSDKQH
jgi:hypothetical protein